MIEDLDILRIRCDQLERAVLAMAHICDALVKLSAPGAELEVARAEILIAQAPHDGAGEALMDSPYWYRMPSDDLLPSSVVLAHRGYRDALDAFAAADLADVSADGGSESMHARYEGM